MAKPDKPASSVPEEWIEENQDLCKNSSTKKGGPYTKQEQEQRRVKVHELHFEKYISARKIEKILCVSRNTVNSDIKYWYTQLVSQMGEQDAGGILLKQIERLESQGSRLLEELDKHEKFEERVIIEKLLSEIGNRLAQIATKIVASKKRIIDLRIELDEIQEKDIKELVRDLILQNDDPDADDVYSENEIQFEFIRKTKCDMQIAKNIVSKMKELGLYLCEITGFGGVGMSIDFSQRYHLVKFANLRSYVTIDEFAKISRKRLEIRKEIECLEKRDEKFIEKYGSDQSKWPEDVKEKYYETDDFPD